MAKQKSHDFKNKCKELLKAVWILFSGLLTVHSVRANAQTVTQEKLSLTLSQAMNYARQQNKWVQAAGLEEMAAAADRKTAYAAALPTINIGSSYQRYSNLTLFKDGLSDAVSGPPLPSSNAAALGVDASFRIYNGGKLHALQNEENVHVNLARLNNSDQAACAALETTRQYLDLVRLNDLEKFILDQLKRAQTRLNNINALYKNQKVTRSDVLRAEVALSNVTLSLEQNKNDITIAIQKLDILMGLPDTVLIAAIDSAGMPKPDLNALLPLVNGVTAFSFTLLKAAENVALQRAKLKEVQSNNKPSLNFFAAYGLNYPNRLFFPPVDQAYALGFAGLKAEYSLSSLYHNKSKITANRIRVREMETQQEARADDVKTEIKSYYIKYAEALNRITVNEHSVQQSLVNYQIVNTKYLNQLALLTDLLDADNLYQESRFNLVKAQTDALFIYYRILYTSGKI